MPNEPDKCLEVSLGTFCICAFACLPATPALCLCMPATLPASPPATFYHGISSFIFLPLFLLISIQAFTFGLSLFGLSLVWQDLGFGILWFGLAGTCCVHGIYLPHLSIHPVPDDWENLKEEAD